MRSPTDAEIRIRLATNLESKFLFEELVAPEQRVNLNAGAFEPSIFSKKRVAKALNRPLKQKQARLKMLKLQALTVLKSQKLFCTNRMQLQTL